MSRSIPEGVQAHAAGPVSLAVHPNGETIYTAGADGELKLYSAALDSSTSAAQQHEGAITALALHPSGRQLATLGADHKAFLYSATATGVEMSALVHRFTTAALAAAFNPRTARVAVSGDASDLRMITLADPIKVSRLYGHLAAVKHLEFDPKGAFMLSGDARGTLRFWDVLLQPKAGSAPPPPTVVALELKNEPNALGKAAGEPGAWSRFAFHPSGCHVALPGAGSVALLARGTWDRRDGVESATAHGHAAGAVVDLTAWSPNGRYLATAGRGDGRICVWDMHAAVKIALEGATDDALVATFAAEAADTAFTALQWAPRANALYIATAAGRVARVDEPVPAAAPSPLGAPKPLPVPEPPKRGAKSPAVKRKDAATPKGSAAASAAATPAAPAAAPVTVTVTPAAAAAATANASVARVPSLTDPAAPSSPARSATSAAAASAPASPALIATSAQPASPARVASPARAPASPARAAASPAAGPAAASKLVRRMDSLATHDEDDNDEDQIGRGKPRRRTAMADDDDDDDDGYGAAHTGHGEDEEKSASSSSSSASKSDARRLDASDSEDEGEGVYADDYAVNDLAHKLLRGLVGERQAPFQSGSAPAPARGDAVAHALLQWNAAGLVRRVPLGGREANIVATLAPMGAERRPMRTFADMRGYSLAALTQAGVALASAGDSKRRNREGKRSGLACVSFRGFKPSAASDGSDWDVELPEGEMALAVAAGVTWIAVATSSQLLRVFTLTGLLKDVIRLPGPVVTLAASDTQLAVAYHGHALPPAGEQALRLQLFTIDALLTRVAYDGVLPLSPRARLMWLGFSEEGLLFSHDSADVLCMLAQARGFIWAPLFAADKLNEKANDKSFHWPVSVSQRGLVCHISDSVRRPPQLTSIEPPYSQSVPLSIPEVVGSSREARLLEEITRARLLAAEIMAMSGNDVFASAVKESQATQRKHDATLTGLLRASVEAGRPERALDLAGWFGDIDALDRATEAVNMTRKAPQLVIQLNALLAAMKEASGRASAAAVGSGVALGTGAVPIGAKPAKLSALAEQVKAVPRSHIVTEEDVNNYFGDDDSSTNKSAQKRTSTSSARGTAPLSPSRLKRTTGDNGATSAASTASPVKRARPAGPAVNPFKKN